MVGAVVSVVNIDCRPCRPSATPTQSCIILAMGDCLPYSNVEYAKDRSASCSSVILTIVSLALCGSACQDELLEMKEISSVCNSLPFSTRGAINKAILSSLISSSLDSDFEEKAPVFLSCNTIVFKAAESTGFVLSLYTMVSFAGLVQLKKTKINRKGIR